MMDQSNTLSQKEPVSGLVRLSTFVAELYIALLPFKMIIQFSFLNTMFGACALYLDFVLNMLGLLLLFIRNKGIFYFHKDKVSSLFNYFFLVIVTLNLSSFFMAILLHEKLGTIGGEDTYRAIAGQIVYYFQYLFIVLYNREVFRLVPKEKIERILNRLILALLLLGYLQIAIILFGGVFIKIQETLDIGQILRPASYSILEKRLSLVGSEPASAGGLICRVVLPFLLAKSLYYGDSKRTWIEILLWLPVLYFTKSSTGYVLFAFCILTFLYLKLGVNKYRIKLYWKKFALGFCVMVFILLLSIPLTQKIVNTNIIQQIDYILVDRVVNPTDQTAMARKVPLVINYRCFLAYPILGVGNGNQGFFYIKYFPQWAYSSYDVTLLLSEASKSPGNGSLFFPGILSGYGLAGVTLILVYVHKCRKLILEKKKEMGMFYYMFLLSAIVIFVNGFSSEFTGNYGIWFLISLPYIAGETYNQQQINI